MKTYPDENQKPEDAVGFEIDNIYITLGTVVRILQSINGVTDIEKRRLFSEWKDIHIWFRYLSHECVVVEPFGDSSRYWIGPKNPGEKFDFSRIENAFRYHRPPLIVKIVGDLITLNFKCTSKSH